MKGKDITYEVTVQYGIDTNKVSLNQLCHIIAMIVQDRFTICTETMHMTKQTAIQR